MAKTTKKSESKEEPKPKAAAKKPAAKPETKAAAPAAKPAAAAAKPVAQAAAKKSAPTPEGKSSTKPSRMNLQGGSGIDTNLAASAAANLLWARRKGRDQMGSSASVDQIKSDLSKTASTVAGEMLDQHAASTGGHRPNLPQGGFAPQSQTVGNAAARTSVPRRTGG